MNSTMITLFARDLRKALNLRAWLIWLALAGMGIFFFFATGAKTELLENGRIEYMSLFLPHMIFGAWAVLAVSFDLISSDRQHNVLDCILSSGVSKSVVFFSKILVTAVISLILSVIYLLPLALVSVGSDAECESDRPRCYDAGFVRDGGYEPVCAGDDGFFREYFGASCAWIYDVYSPG